MTVPRTAAETAALDARTSVPPTRPARTPRPGGGRAGGLASGRLPRFITWYVLAGCAVAIGALSVATGMGVGGWGVLTAVLYLVVITTLSVVYETRRKAVDRLVAGLVSAAFVLAMLPLVSTLWTVVSKGIGALTWEFVSTTGGSQLDPETLKIVTTDGALQAIVGTLYTTGVAALISVPIGLLTAVYLVEYAQPGQWLRRTVNFLVDVMTGIPSIVAGLFAFALFSIVVGPKAFSGFSAAVALSVLMIPVVVRSSEEMLRLVPMDLREASYALGVPKYVTILRIVIPTAIAGLTTGVTLAIARIIGETAPILMAASFTDNFNSNLFSGPMQTLPVMAYTKYTYPGSDIPASHASAWGAALLLVILVMLLNVIARIVAKVFAPKGAR